MNQIDFLVHEINLKGFQDKVNTTRPYQVMGQSYGIPDQSGSL